MKNKDRFLLLRSMYELKFISPSNNSGIKAKGGSIVATLSQRETRLIGYKPSLLIIGLKYSLFLNINNGHLRVAFLF